MLVFQFRGLYRGGLSTFLRESIGNAVFFSTYELSRHYLHSQLNSAPSALSHHSKLLIDTGIGIVTGGLSGTAVSKDKSSTSYNITINIFFCFSFFSQFWLAVLPLDVAKTVIQTSPDHNVNQNPFGTLKLVCYPFAIRLFLMRILAEGLWSFFLSRFTGELA